MTSGDFCSVSVSLCASHLFRGRFVASLFRIGQGMQPFVFSRKKQRGWEPFGCQAGQPGQPAGCAMSNALTFGIFFIFYFSMFFMFLKKIRSVEISVLM